MPHSILQERAAVFLGAVAAVGGTIGTYVSSLGHQASRFAGHAVYGAIDANAVSSWTLVAVNALTALAGGICFVLAQVSKTRRESRVADDLAFKDSWESKIQDLKESSDARIGKLENDLALSDKRFELLSQKLALVKGERNLLRDKLNEISRQNERQTRGQKVIAANVKAIGEAVNAPMSDEANGTANDMPTIPKEAAGDA